MKKPRYSSVADEGVHTVGRIFNRVFRWAFRLQPIADVGIDAQVEVCKRHKPTGRLIGLQIKSGESYFKETALEGYVYRGSLEHLRYWLTYPIPVLVILYNPSSERVYWQVVKPEKMTVLEKGWKMALPYKQRLDSHALRPLLEIVGETADETNFKDFEVERDEETDLPDGVVSEAHIRNVASRTVYKAKSHVEDLCDRLWRFQIPLAEWQLDMESLIKAVYLGLFAVGRGGFRRVSDADFKRIGGMIRQSYGALQEFLKEISQGSYGPNDVEAFTQRSMMFIDHGRTAFELGCDVRRAEKIEFYASKGRILTRQLPKEGT